MASTDPIIGQIQNHLPMLMPVLDMISKNRQVEFDGSLLRLPMSWENLANFSNTLSNSLDRSTVEKVMQPVSREVEQFHRSMAYSINRGMFGMDDTRAKEMAKNKVSGGRIMAFIMGRASGIDGVVQNLEVAAHRAGVKPTSYAGLRAKTRNQRVSQLLSFQFADLMNPKNRGRMGIWNPIEASRMLATNIHEYEDVVRDKKYWTRSNQLTVDGLQQIRNKFYDRADALSAAVMSGLVTDESPELASEQLNQLFGYDPVSRHGGRPVRRMFLDLNAVANSTGHSPEEIRELAPSILSHGGDHRNNIGVLKDFLVAHHAAKRTGQEPTPEFNEALLGAIRGTREKVQSAFAGIYTIAKERMGEDGANQVMQQLYQDPEALRGTSQLIQAFGDITGHRVDRQTVMAASYSDDAGNYLSSSGFITPMLQKSILNNLNEKRLGALRNAGLGYLSEGLEGAITMEGLERNARRYPNHHIALFKARRALEDMGDNIEVSDTFTRTFGMDNPYLKDLAKEREIRTKQHSDFSDYRRQEGVYTGPFGHILQALTSEDAKSGEGVWSNMFTGLLGGGKQQELLNELGGR